MFGAKSPRQPENVRAARGVTRGPHLLRSENAAPPSGTVAGTIRAHLRCPPAPPFGGAGWASTDPASSADRALIPRSRRPRDRDPRQLRGERAPDEGSPSWAP